MLTDLTLHMMIPTYHMAKSSGCVSNELVWIVALASSSTIRNKSLFYQKNELTLTLTVINNLTFLPNVLIRTHIPSMSLILQVNECLSLAL